MRYGFVLPGGTATEQLAQASLAEAAGWDGVFIWEAAYGVDAWTLLAAIAGHTERIKLGTMLTPLPWRRPWKVASQAATLDQLSGGRAILALGLGAIGGGLDHRGEVTNLRTRAAMLDEGIDLIKRCWAGKLQYDGQHSQFDLTARPDLAEVATRVQAAIPIWVVGAWPREKSMRRVLRCDGLVPEVIRETGAREATPDDIRAIRAWLGEHGARPDFEIVMEGETPPDDTTNAAAIVTPWADAGCTWWLDTRWEMPHHSEERLRQVRERLAAGPPRLAHVAADE